ncbi:MAG: MnhB domain-containing protein, partial [Verrucomicrobiia bacterium]
MKDPGSFMLRAAASVLLFVLNLFAIYLLLRGHNFPGGGFIGGLASAMAILLYGLAVGFERAEAQLGFGPIKMAALGLGLAVVTSMVPMLVGQTYFEHSMFHLELPFFGELHVGTTLLFDVGVFLVVVGITVKIIFVIARSTSGLPALLPAGIARYSARLEEPIEESAPDLTPDPNVGEDVNRPREMRDDR